MTNIGASGTLVLLRGVVWAVLVWAVLVAAVAADVFGVADIANDPVQVAVFIRRGIDRLTGDIPCGLLLLIREFPLSSG